MEAAKVLQRKYGCMSEAGRLTEEASQALGRGDKVSAQMILGMREEEIDKLRECDRKLSLLRENAPQELNKWLGKALQGKDAVTEEPYGKEGAMVLRVAGNIRSAWEKTMRVDRQMNMRLAGKDSFYAGK